MEIEKDKPNALYYSGLLNFLSKTPSVLKQINSDIIYVIKNDNLVISHKNEIRDSCKIISETVTDDYLKLEIEEKDFGLSDSTPIYIVKTNRINEENKPIFEIRILNSTSLDFVLNLIK